MKKINWKQIKKLLTVTAVTALVAATAAGCGSSSEKSGSSESGSTDKDSASKVVRIVGAGIDTSGNASLVGNSAVARSQGYIEDELKAIGYTVEFSGFQTAGVGANEALAAKEADIAIYGDFPAITYISNGNDATIFAISTTRNQIGIFAKDDIKSIKDLKGKKVNTMFGTVAYQYLVQALEENGLSLEDIELINATPVDATSLYLSGEIDAIVNGPQAYWPLIAQGKGHQVAVNGDSESLSNSHVAIGRKEYLEENPDVAEAIVKALKKAQDYANANEEEVYKQLAEASGGNGSAEDYKDYYSFEEGFPDYSPYITSQIIEHLQNTADFMYDNKYISKEINIKDYIDDSIQE